MIRTRLSLALLLFTLIGCSPSEQAPGQSQTSQSQPGQAASSPFKLSGDTKHIMQWVLDPAADHIWDSAGSIITAAGTRELAPTTEEGWLSVQYGAAVVAATGNLLMMPGRAVDDKDWQKTSQALVDAGLLAQSAAKAHDADALFDAGSQIYRICKACHSAYIQGEKAEGSP